MDVESWELMTKKGELRRAMREGAEGGMWVTRESLGLKPSKKRTPTGCDGGKKIEGENKVVLVH